jgi:hypothetical protein
MRGIEKSLTSSRCSNAAALLRVRHVVVSSGDMEDGARDIAIIVIVNQQKVWCTTPVTLKIVSINLFRR